MSESTDLQEPASLSDCGHQTHWGSAPETAGRCRTHPPKTQSTCGQYSVSASQPGCAQVLDVEDDMTGKDRGDNGNATAESSSTQCNTDSHTSHRHPCISTTATPELSDPRLDSTGSICSEHDCQHLTEAEWKQSRVYGDGSKALDHSLKRCAESCVNNSEDTVGCCDDSAREENSEKCDGDDANVTFENDGVGKEEVEDGAEKDYSSDVSITTAAEASLIQGEAAVLLDTEDAAARQADDVRIIDEQHALSGPLRVNRLSRQHHHQGVRVRAQQPRHISLPVSMMAQWRAVGQQWGLQDDDDIARILIRHYEDIVAGRPPRGPRARCQECGEVLVPLPCEICGPNQHSSRLSHDRHHGASASGKSGFCGRCRD